MKDISSVLIIGMAGGLAQIIAGVLARRYPHLQITGVDARNIDESLQIENIEYRKMRYTRGNFEKIFREKKFDLVMHLARMSHVTPSPMARLAKRLELDLMGTQIILDLCLKFCVKKVVVLSTFHVYGALPDNPVFIPEDYPLRAAIKHPQLRDVVEMDQLCTNWMWKNRDKVNTIILRPCNIIGPKINNTITQYLTTPYSPVCMDFNPMFQFIHEFDMTDILINSLEKVPTGVYNVSTNDSISIKETKKYLHIPMLSLPSFMLTAGAHLLNTSSWSLPPYLIDYLKFSSIIDNSSINSFLSDHSYNYTTNEALDLLRLN